MISVGEMIGPCCNKPPGPMLPPMFISRSGMVRTPSRKALYTAPAWNSTCLEINNKKLNMPPNKQQETFVQTNELPDINIIINNHKLNDKIQKHCTQICSKGYGSITPIVRIEDFFVGAHYQR